MHFLTHFLALFALFFLSATALKQENQILISFPKDAPQSDVDKAMELLREAGGVIKHEYKLIKGFAASASDAAIESIKAMGSKYPPIVEMDSIVSVDGKVGDN